MEKLKNGKLCQKKGSDLINKISTKSKAASKKNNNSVPTIIKDKIVVADGRVFYPCRFCNKVFPIKKTREIHIKKCPAKEYILSVGDNSRVEITKQHIPVKKSPPKIDIQQNIVLNEQLNIDDILSQTKTPPIKLTIRRSPSNGGEVPNHFTVSNSLVLKEKNEADEFSSIAKRLESNSVTIIKQPKEEDNTNKKLDNLETMCRECNQEFGSQMELLRHSRKCHSYPKVLMALSEVKKFYSVKDRSECPICHKPLKTNFRSAFIKHLHIHTNEMKYSCNVCNRKFRRSDHMKAHEKRHIVKDN